MNDVLTSHLHLGAGALTDIDERFEDKIRPFIAKMRVRNSKENGLAAAFPASLKVFPHEQ